MGEGFGGTKYCTSSCVVHGGDHLDIFLVSYLNFLHIWCCYIVQWEAVLESIAAPKQIDVLFIEFHHVEFFPGQYHHLFAWEEWEEKYIVSKYYIMASNTATFTQ